MGQPLKMGRITILVKNVETGGKEKVWKQKREQSEFLVSWLVSPPRKKFVSPCKHTYTRTCSSRLVFRGEVDSPSLWGCVQKIYIWSKKNPSPSQIESLFPLVSFPRRPTYVTLPNLIPPVCLELQKSRISWNWPDLRQASANGSKPLVKADSL